MEVLLPSQSPDFDFNSARSSPHASLPSTPRRLGEYYFSAPTSPSHITQFYTEFDEFLLDAARQSPAVPFRWEEKPGTPKPAVINDDLDFAFDVGRDDWETASLSAEELFDGGVIRPLKPPPRASPVRKQRSQARRMIQGAFSPRHRKNGETSSAAERGRERGVALSRPPSRRAARSLSPMRDDHQRYLWEEEAAQTGKANSVCAAAAPSKGQKKWSLKDFFLFRSASEGRAADKDPLKKYTAALRRSSFRAIDSPGSRRKGPVSAHELHYTVNRAVSEDMKRKTFLPYKQGILGRLAFNPAIHALANGFGLSRN
ncbi:hypothetical protein AAHA92_27861 [Salvia divinorum]|uniref:Uncharacterized protein n=1 Tax=Salvia divinorum TaxID=28513 RepID=A0ABD1G516_SALDI